MAPRYSIIPGAFVEDPRPRHLHYRIINLLGRHTDDEGWCRLRQERMGAYLKNEDGTVVHRVTVNRAVKELVEWGYLETHQAETGGRALWYRVIMDRPGGPPTRSNDESDDCDDECSETTTSGDVASMATSGVAIRGYNKNDLSLTTKTLPNPSERGFSEKPRGGQWKDEALAALRVGGHHRDAVEVLIAPLLSSDKRLSLGQPSDVVAVLASLAEAAHGISKTSLEEAAKRLLAQPSKLTPQRIREAIDIARKAGAMIMVRRGTAQHQQWLERFRRTNPDMARLAERHDVQVPSEWPPASGEAQEVAA